MEPTLIQSFALNMVPQAPLEVIIEHIEPKEGPEYIQV